MSLIKSQIDKKINSLNDNGKVQYLLEILQHCLNSFPDLEKASINAVGEKIDQLVSFVKYFLLTNNETLKNLNSMQIDDLREIQQANNNLEKKINTCKNDLQIEQLNKKELNELNQTLININDLTNKLNIPDYDLILLTNKFKHISSLSREIPELKLIQDKCKKEIDDFSDKLKSIMSEKEEFENLLRSKINEI